MSGEPPSTRDPPPFEQLQSHALRIMQGVLGACDPVALLKPHWPSLPPGPVHLIAFGKASRRMCAAAGAALGDRIRFGICVSSEDQLARPEGFPSTVGIMRADHPLPTLDNLEAAEAVRFAVSEFSDAGRRGERATLLALVSGGGSAHLALPADGLGLDDLRSLIGALLTAGATIEQMNCIRKHVEKLKGGRLGVLATAGGGAKGPADVRVFVLSDVIGDAPDVIASGPFAPDPTTFREAFATLRALRLEDRLPRIADFLERGRDGSLPETPKPGDPRLASVQHAIVGSNRHALAAAAAEAERLGFRVARCESAVVESPGVFRDGLSGAARDAGAALARALLDLRRDGARGSAIILGGETTVEVRGRGIGGRNQELALAAALAFAGTPGVAVMTLGTDGIDGPTDAAGAMVTGETIPEATRRGLDPAGALERNDSYTVLSKLADTPHTTVFKPGATGTNLCDVAVGLVY